MRGSTGTHSSSSRKLGGIGGKCFPEKVNLELNSRSIPFKIINKNIFSSTIPKAIPQEDYYTALANENEMKNFHTRVSL